MPELRAHRDHIEKHRLGFGARAFHYMWWLVLQELRDRYPRRSVLAMEIGVYKGQVILFWSLLNKTRDIPIEITAIGVIHDLQTYSPLVSSSGLLVMDDGSYFLPGSRFWKGHKQVSKACRIIEGLGFANSLNVGHNRVYQRIDRAA